MPFNDGPDQPWNIVEKIGIFNTQKVATNTTLITLPFSNVFSLSVITDDPVGGNLQIIKEHPNDKIDRPDDDSQNCFDELHYTLRVSGYIWIVNQLFEDALNEGSSCSSNQFRNVAFL